MDREFDAALRAFAAGNYGGARQICRAILATHPTHRDAVHLLAELCLKGDDAEEAGDLAIGLLEADSGDVRAWRMLGEARLSQRRYAEAVEALREATELAPQHGGGHARLAAALRRAEEHDAATASYARAIACKPADPSHFIEFATFLITLGRDREAIDVLDEAAQVNPANPRIWWMLADRLRACGRREAALGAYRRGVACSRGIFGLYFDFATLLLELGRGEAALNAARKAQAAEPDHPMVHDLVQTVMLSIGGRAAQVS